MNQMMNNPVMMLINAARSGANPMALIQQMAGQSPEMARIAQMFNGKTSEQLRQMAENMAKERGTTVGEVAKSLGINLPK